MNPASPRPERRVESAQTADQTIGDAFGDKTMATSSDPSTWARVDDRLKTLGVSASSRDHLCSAYSADRQQPVPAAQTSNVQAWYRDACVLAAHGLFDVPSSVVRRAIYGELRAAGLLST
jgi:hypothetical protein